MEKKILGNSEIEVTCLGLGTMTFGEQNTEKDAFAQMDCAISFGVNLIDTAEMYPIPPRKETFTRAEKFIGKWIKQRRVRDKIILATKVVGPTSSSRAMSGYIRDGVNRLNKKNIIAALDGSLVRLGTETIDLYQIHWPDRDVNIFGKRDFKYPKSKMSENVEIEETLETLEKLSESGKIRAFGVSNETPWGVMSYLNLSKRKGWGRIVSIQNPYNLLNRTFEQGLAEISYKESIGFLAYSPLAFGMLTGKYNDGLQPARARLTLYSRFKRYQTKNAMRATSEYVRLANEHSLNPTQMALAYVRTRPFLSSVLIGATSIEQLELNLESLSIDLTEEILEGIEKIHMRIPNPIS